MDWKDSTCSLDWLNMTLDECQEGCYTGQQTMIDWLKHIGVIPDEIVWKRSNASTRTNLDADNIKAGYLAELAYDWDKDGPSEVREFLESLEFEVTGHWRNRQVSEVLGSLGR